MIEPPKTVWIILFEGRIGGAYSNEATARSLAQKGDVVAEYVRVPPPAHVVRDMIGNEVSVGDELYVVSTMRWERILTLVNCPPNPLIPGHYATIGRTNNGDFIIEYSSCRKPARESGE